MNEEQIEKLLHAIRDISHGGSFGPCGLESVAMAIAGDGLPTLGFRITGTSFRS